MSMSDPIADMLTRIRNAGRANKTNVDIPASKLKKDIAGVLKNEGYIRGYKFIEDNKQGIVKIYLKYFGQEKKHVIYNIQRVSKPSRRVYVKSKAVEPVLNGLGIAILSTSFGIMSDKQARMKNIGGEILCNVW